MSCFLLAQLIWAESQSSPILLGERWWASVIHWREQYFLTSSIYHRPTTSSTNLHDSNRSFHSIVGCCYCTKHRSSILCLMQIWRHQCTEMAACTGCFHGLHIPLSFVHSWRQVLFWIFIFATQLIGVTMQLTNDTDCKFTALATWHFPDWQPRLTWFDQQIPLTATPPTTNLCLSENG